jgi:hypothetical protein
MTSAGKAPRNAMIDLIPLLLDPSVLLVFDIFFLQLVHMIKLEC